MIAVGFLVLVAVIVVGLKVAPSALQGSFLASTNTIDMAAIQNIQNDVANLKLQVANNYTDLQNTKILELADQKMLYNGVMVLNNALVILQRQLNIPIGVDSNYPTKK